MSNRFDSAEEVETAFYAALEAGDPDALEEIWMCSPDVVCVHPGGPQLLGYEQVLQSWREILSNSGGFRLSTRVLHEHGDDSVSVRFLNEILFTGDEQTESFTVLATNAYRRTQTGWRLILHHASPPPRPDDRPEAPVEHTEPEDPGITLH